MAAAIPSDTEALPPAEFGEKYEWLEVVQDHVRIAVVGDRGCGKSCLILSAKNQTLPDPEENFFSKRYPLDLEGTKGMVVDVDEFREVYQDSDVILLCFALNDPSSFESISNKWVLREHLPKKRCILVGLKQDLRKIGDLSGQAENLREKLDFHKYMECSAYTKKGVLPVFREAFKCATLEK
ncbi:ras-related protein rac-2 [Nephila pilipes]|uniref:Ras-related protein rac-2 n=1 Tax=Nephila pilipes TaxID=299642 RepID=A0A8X6QFV0_NEPPI|nr:ras-related protein rac-2 [Nephila pilipes]